MVEPRVPNDAATLHAAHNHAPTGSEVLDIDIMLSFPFSYDRLPEPFLKSNRTCTWVIHAYKNNQPLTWDQLAVVEYIAYPGSPDEANFYNGEPPIYSFHHTTENFVMYVYAEDSDGDYGHATLNQNVSSSGALCDDIV
jgi:hypothetical protein